ncbi:AI-2E family transporter [Catenovulum sp. 2E275]|uniref:AI-2E family transporter n=1 Tax=Catenovulum sp. 2E275 TaxID=2980497 RepID=UPI0021D072C4|nr:AI-2E family transporter [Catenovulum sp. 2E275]MCU4675701.1 AI-2E family transporter [Catenovulum sp. 2E275]
MPFTQNPAVRLLLTLAALVVILAGIKTSQQLVVPFLLSLFIAIICQPVINFLESFKIPKVLAVTLVILVIVTLGFSLASLVGQSLNSFSEDLPQYKEKLQGEIGWLTNKLAEFNVHLNREQFVEYFDPGAAMSLATNMLSGLGNTLANVFLILITTVFMLFEANAVREKLQTAWKKPNQHIDRVYRFLRSVNHYLAIKTVISIGTGILAGLLCWTVGVDYFVLWGVLAFLFNYIPNIGSIIAAIPVVLLALIQVSPLAAGITAIGYVVINTVMGNIVEPKYMGRGLGLSSLVVFLSLIFWGWLLGTVGMLLSVPLTMVVKIATEASDSTRWFAVMLSNQQELEYMENNKNQPQEQVESEEKQA